MGDVTNLNAPSIDTIFMNTVSALRDSINDMNLYNRSLTGAAEKNRTESLITQAHIDSIEVELVFKSVAVDGSSKAAKLLFADKQTSSSLEIRLATRVRVD